MSRLTFTFLGLFVLLTGCFSQKSSSKVTLAESALETRITLLISQMTTAEKITQIANDSFMTTSRNFRLHIPGFVMDDGPHGVRFEKATAFPTGMAMSSTWDRDFIEKAGFGVVRDLSGHGVGRNLQEPPAIPNFGPTGTGPVLKEGMTLALEPMVTAGDWHVKVKPDGWTVATADGSLSAHFEHSIVVTKTGAEVLTKI